MATEETTAEVTEQAAAAPASEETQAAAPEPQEPSTPEPARSEPQDSKQTLSDALDSLTKTPEPSEAPSDRVDPETFGGEPKNPTAEAKPLEPTPKPEPAAEPAPKAPTAEAPTDEELIRAIPSERGRSRIQQIVAERQQALQASQNFLEAVTGAGYDDETFSQVLQLGRWISSPDREDRVRAMQFLETVRENIAKDIGEPVEGKDVLDPDLREKVNNLELTEDGALEILRARRQLQSQKADAEALQRFRDQQTANDQAIQQGRNVVVQTLAAHKQELDYAPRIRAVRDWLQHPANMQQIINQGPANWGNAVEFLYRNIAVQKQRPSSPQPLTSTTMRRGTAETSNPRDPQAGLMAYFREHGI